jgi:hypothetical protein
MIVLTEEQMGAMEAADAGPSRVVNPRTNETFVLLRLDEYERLKEEYDDSPWTREELQALAWDRVKQEGWDEYDDLPEKHDEGRPGLPVHRREHGRRQSDRATH